MTTSRNTILVLCVFLLAMSAAIAGTTTPKEIKVVSSAGGPDPVHRTPLLRILLSVIGAVTHVGVFDGFSIVSTWPQAGHWYVINSGIAPTRGTRLTGAGPSPRQLQSSGRS